MSDNELDDLFREAAEGFKPPQDSSAWSSMADRLDNASPAGGFWNWKTISGTAVTGIIAVTAIWWYATTKDSQPLKNNQTQKKYGANRATQSIAQEQKEQTQLAGTENFAPAQSLESKNYSADALSEPKAANADRVIQKRSADHTERNTSSANNQVIPFDSDKMASFVITKDSKYDALPGMQESAGERLMVSDSSKIVLNDLKTDSAENISNAADKKDRKGNSGGVFSLKAAISPDFSSVDFFSAGKMGANYGLLAGYSFNKRWSVYTGIISSRKLYSTENVRGYYNANGHDYPMKELDGDCWILDIPINVYYTFFPEHSFSLRAGLGFSSYIMRKENYVYCVDDYGNDVYYKQNVRGKNNEWLKVMNLSVLVSKKITSRISAEFEPFIKAPLAGVGEGKVSLVSMGAFINLRYDLVIIK